MIGCAVAIGALLADTAVATPWTRTSAGLPDKWVDANDVEHNAVRALAQLDGAIYAGLARGGVYRSVDNAANDRQAVAAVAQRGDRLEIANFGLK